MTANQRKQRKKANADKLRSERRFKKLLTPYVQEVLQSYRIGNTSVDLEARSELRRGLRAGYIAAASNVLNVNDIRRYKQTEEDILEQMRSELASQLDEAIVFRTTAQENTIARTTAHSVSSATKFSIASGWSIKEAKAWLANRLKNQRRTVATTESQWVVESGRKFAVVNLTQPIKNGIEEIARLLSIGDTAGARKLAREMEKLAKLPLSEGQGNIIRYISDNREELVKPAVQARILSNLRDRASKLDVNKKIWMTFGDGKVRDTHIMTEGQEQPIDKPFILPGGLLQYPGDASLGASLDEIINCRCVALYE